MTDTNEEQYGEDVLGLDYIESTMEQIQHFTDGAIWEDIRRQLILWIEDKRNALEDCDDISTIKWVQGHINAYRQLMELPGILAAAVAVESKQEE